MPDLHELLDSYLKDHFAGASAGRDLFRRAADAHEGTDLGSVLAALAAEVDADRDAQRDIMQGLGVEPSTPLAFAGRLAEQAGRLKTNATALRRSPLTDVVEVEGLRIAVYGKLCGWEALLAASVAEPRLSKVRLEELIARAHDQLDRLHTLHVQVARERFAAAEGARHPLAE